MTEEKVIDKIPEISRETFLSIITALYLSENNKVRYQSNITYERYLLCTWNFLNKNGIFIMDIVLDDKRNFFNFVLVASLTNKQDIHLSTKRGYSIEEIVETIYKYI